MFEMPAEGAREAELASEEAARVAKHETKAAS